MNVIALRCVHSMCHECKYCFTIIFIIVKESLDIVLVSVEYNDVLNIDFSRFIIQTPIYYLDFEIIIYRSLIAKLL